MKSLEELKKLRDESIKNVEMRNTDKDVRVVVGMATCGISAGARPVLSTFVEEVAKRNLNNVSVVQTGCIGMCTYEPIVEIYSPGKEKVTYIHIDSEKAKRIVSEHLANNRVVAEYTIGSEN
ncbi:MAG: (2Fe-2S) ferredoxin domain-containing protein [Tissierellia bacterium]|jgi:(2Fe-2S) ferredoxin|nr:(2Fe-2S) ferredoxin domain-containing protein [Tissierellia bacterium]MDD3225922.1 (2Fe-2S) ferredoxin domain-containing protein [Tissierellia bacterium]MDD3750739.1 (2Fe-2S) ferredoxin domain-containing protein [Tissierellia bacterium]MDD4045849.1 (2Fe-2S) ferredoxin domain-containing protein [Tissierellia bacterium]MDD4678033.1 (2Fe-2S) ferredoxin domain-containing protein [Tissierellia bacterium]